MNDFAVNCNSPVVVISLLVGVLVFVVCYALQGRAIKKLRARRIDGAAFSAHVLEKAQKDSNKLLQDEALIRFAVTMLNDYIVNRDTGDKIDNIDKVKIALDRLRQSWVFNESHRDRGFGKNLSKRIREQYEVDEKLRNDMIQARKNPPVLPTGGKVEDVPRGK